MSEVYILLFWHLLLELASLSQKVGLRMSAQKKCRHLDNANLRGETVVELFIAWVKDLRFAGSLSGRFMSCAELMCSMLQIHWQAVMHLTDSASFAMLLLLQDNLTVDDNIHFRRFYLNYPCQHCKKRSSEVSKQWPFGTCVKVVVTQDAIENQVHLCLCSTFQHSYLYMYSWNILSMFSFCQSAGRTKDEVAKKRPQMLAEAFCGRASSAKGSAWQSFSRYASCQS